MIKMFIKMTLKFMYLILISGFLLFLAFPMMAQQTGWEADPGLIEQLQENRPEYIWEESGVPDFELPDPLLKPDGTVVRSPEEWDARRANILETFRTKVYGHRPGQPEHLSFEVSEINRQAMDGRATLKRVNIISGHQGRNHQFEVILFLPNDIDEPAPVFLLLNNRGIDNTDPDREEKSGFWPAEEVIDRGYGIAAIQNNDLSPDDTERFHEGIIRLFEGDITVSERPADAWMALAAWGWGASRVMDYFETDPDVDEQKIALLGHSRGGKASLWAGAEDERFALVISNESGAGGAALSKREFGETVEAVNRFTHWFTANFKEYNGHEQNLPIDQHMLISLIAPRAVYVASADEDLWADPRGEYLSLAHASPVYALWGHDVIDPDNMPALNNPVTYPKRGYHIRSGGHNLTPQDWGYFMDFADQLWR
jgi:hypothetical protein